MIIKTFYFSLSLKTLLNITNKYNYPGNKRINPTCAWMHPTLCTCTRNVFGVQLYKNNVRALLSHILSIVNLDWLQHSRSVHGVYELCLILCDSLHIGNHLFYLHLAWLIHGERAIYQLYTVYIKNKQLLDWPFTRLLLESLYIKMSIYLQAKNHGLGLSNC